MGTGNISSKVLIVVWRLIDHRGYLIIKQDLSLMRLRIVKQYLLLQSPWWQRSYLLHRPVLGRVSGKTAGAEWAQDGVSYASSQTLQSWHLDNVLMAIQPYPSLFRSSHTRDRSWKVAFIYHWQQEQRIPTKHKNLLRTYGSPFTQERSKPVSKSISKGKLWLMTVFIWESESVMLDSDEII